MGELTTRRDLLIATLSSASGIPTGPSPPEMCRSPDLLPALRTRFGLRLHPDVRAVHLSNQAGTFCLEMVVGPNAAWAGAFCDFDNLHSASELRVINELTCPLDVVEFSPTDSLQLSTERLLTSSRLEVLCRMVGLIFGAADRQYSPDNLAR